MTELSDFHIHPGYSIDARGTIRQYCDRALEIGIKHICFTTHYDKNPKRFELDAYWRKNGRKILVTDSIIADYINEIEKEKVFFSPFGLNIYPGLEFDYFEGVENEVVRIRNLFPLEFVIGSVHCLDDIAISDIKEAPSYFDRKTLGQMADDYFDLLCRAAEVRGFDCLGHLDYYVRYGRQYYGDEIDRIEMERFDSVFAALKRNDKGIEINTSPYRYGTESFHPQPSIIERALKAGVRITSIGSDSHKPSQLGGGIEEARSFLKERNVVPLFPKVQ